MFKKTTKRALLASVLALVLCVSMLVGTTFAWFTDSVTSSNNIIKSGNLDIVLEYWNGQAWVDVAGKSDIITNTLWEPGATEVAYLRIANAGSLALNYMLGINIVSETAGVNVAGNSFKLSDYIYFDVVEGVSTPFATREAAMEYATEETIISAGYTKADTLLASATEELEYVYLAMIVYMPTTVDNVANHDGTNVPQIDLGINVFATQAAAETDAFDNQYDNLTIVETPAALAEAIAAGEDVMLNADINLNNPMARTAGLNTVVVPVGESVIIDLNGYDIVAASTNNSGNQHAFTVKGDLTVVGEGTISLKHTGENMGWGNLTAVFSVEGGTLTLSEGVTVINEGGTNMAYAVDVNTTGGETTLNVNGATLYSPYTAVRIFNNHATKTGTVNLNAGIVSGAKRDIWAHNPSAKAVDTNAIVNVADGYVFDMTTQDASSFYGRIYQFNTAIVMNGDELKAALAAEKNVILGQDITMVATSGGYTNAGIVVSNGQIVDGNGYTLTVTGAGGTWDCAIYLTNGTIKNITVAGAFRGVFTAGQSADLYLDNVTFKNVVYTFNSDDGNTDYTIYISNSTMSGWTSHSDVHNAVVYTNCTFNKGSGYQFCRPYGPTQFVNCTFAEGYAVDSIGATTFENCTFAGAALTADNLATLVTGNTANATVIQ